MTRFTRTLCAVAPLFLATVSHLPAADLPPDVADLKVEERNAGGDPKKQYFIIQQPVEMPKEGWRTLFVLPGGSGDAEFHPFVARIAKHAVPPSYLVVQLVAPVWTPEQAKQVVWPTENTRLPGVKFSTLDFFLAVRSELAKTHRLDPRYSFSLTWSSSGMNGYAFSVHPKAGITGTFVAMSVFHPAEVPSLAPAKGRPYYLYHSPQDFIPMTQPEAARKALQKAGAIVELQTYEGGHGWQGDVFGEIGKGITWLETKAAVKPGR
jgi:hypothetical protein